MNDIGYRIKCIRKEMKLNQSQFAKSIGISQGNLSEIEMGNSNPSAETLIAIRLNYIVNLNWLLTGLEIENGVIYEDQDEKKLVNIYRELNDHDRNEIIGILELKKKLRMNS
ncbi:helix-turn-helix transcriptional regulator [Paenibacillus sp. FSL R7-0302]|uniref:helix-turn-helix domain-containing protein n=1 Tax=Paenibacillus sp. FSL R7-0302 TaxID=2921681 RepID=UPI0030F9F5D1